MKKILLAILILLILLTGYLLGIYMGHFPAPKLITNQIAKKMDMSEQEAETLNKVVNLNQVLLQSDNKQEYKHFRKIITSESEQNELVNFIVTDYEKLTDDTKESIRQQLEIDEADFDTLIESLEIAIDNYEKHAVFKTDNEESINEIINKYGLDEDFLNKLTEFQENE
jgi:hypothetical protein